VERASLRVTIDGGLYVPILIIFNYSGNPNRLNSARLLPGQWQGMSGVDKKLNPADPG
jgi:hypothetical protein